MKILSPLALLLVTSSLAACAADSEDIPEITGPVTETAATIHDDGTVSTTTREVSVEEQLAEVDARLAAEAEGTVAIARVVQDSACANASLWVYDQTNFAGNRICFQREGELGGYFNLSSITYTCKMVGYPPRFVCFGWDEKVRSYWAGADGGRFMDDDVPPVSASHWFAAWASLATGDSVVNGADVVMLNPVIN